MDFNYFVLISISGMVIVTLIMIIYLLKKKTKTPETRLFTLLMEVTILSVIVEILMSFFANILEMNIFLKVITSKGYLVVCAFWNVLLTIYTVYIVKGETDINKNSKKKWYAVIFSIFIITSVFVFLLPIEYAYNEARTSWLYTSGPSTYAMTINNALDMVIVVVLIFSTKTNLKDKRLWPAYMYAALCFLVLIIQTSNHMFLLITFCEAIVIVFMYTILEDPNAELVEELTLAKNAADKLSKVKNEFLSSMSHEIRTPLNTIYGLSEDNLEFKENLPNDVIENCNDIMVASKKLMEIVGNILDVNKIDANELEIVEAPYNFKEEIIDLCKLLTPSIGKKEISFYLNIAKEIPSILLGDKEHVKEIISNLITNAIKYTEKGEIRLEVTCSINEKDSIANLTIVCKDTGKGIHPSMIDKIFERFEREEENVNTTLIGTGLGLTITKSLVDLMKGQIKVESEFGKGSTFTVALPQKINKEEE